MRLVPGAADFIESAALDGFQLAIVSGALRREIDLVLELAGLRPHFDVIVAAEDVSACKPDPAGLQPGARGARDRAAALHRHRGFAARSRRGARGRPPLRHAHHLPCRGGLRRRGPGLARLRRPPARPSFPGPMAELDLTLDRERLDRVRHGARSCVTTAGGLPDRRVRARSPACRACSPTIW